MKIRIKILFLLLILSAFFIPLNAQASTIIATADNSLLYQEAGGGFSFQHTDLENNIYENVTVSINVLTGTLNGSDCRFTLTDRYGSLYFTSHSTCEVQLSSDNKIRLIYEGSEFSTLTPGYSYNGTITSENEVYIHWELPMLLPHEENFTLWMGLFGVILFIIGLLIIVYSFRNYPIFSFSDKELVWEKDIVAYGLVALLIGAGLIIVWLLV